MSCLIHFFGPSALA